MTGSAVAIATESQDSSYDAEAAVLCALLSSGASASATLKAIELTPDDFADSRHGLMFNAMVAVVNGGMTADPITVAEQLNRMGELLAAGGKEYIGWLIDVAPSSEGVRSHAMIIREHAKQRRDAMQRSKIASELETIAKAVLVPTTPLSAIATRLTLLRRERRGENRRRFFDARRHSGS